MRLAESERRVLYYSGLLAWVGCHTDAYEQAKWLGDDLTVKRDACYSYDFSRARDATSFLLSRVGAGRPLLCRQRSNFSDEPDDPARAAYLAVRRP
ncbi:MAG TPA: hypothetical protein VFK05_27225 [Polyangiaceae bacterium]|nr:hypothetical protein [Polyangiaceae bacterium]